nr:hypothetical protein SEVIR_1G169800v2 [Setaria viridis]
MFWIIHFVLAKLEKESLPVCSSQHSRGSSAFVISDFVTCEHLLSKEAFHLVIDGKYCSFITSYFFNVLISIHCCLIQPHFLYIIGCHSKIFIYVVHSASSVLKYVCISLP